MKKTLLIGLLFFLSGFTRLDYNAVQLGMPAAKVVKQYGEPYAVNELGDGSLEYEYLERVSMNNQLVYENHFYLTIERGKVISKRFREESRPAYDQLWRVDPNYPTYP